MIEECLVVAFSVSGDDCPLSAAAEAAGATVDCQPPLLRRDGNALVRCSAPLAAADDLAAALDADDRIRYLHASRDDERVNFRCLSKQPCVVHRLTDAGFMAESLQYRAGEESYEGAVVGQDVLQGVLEAAGEAVGVTLQRVHPLADEAPGDVVVRWDLTPAQEEALRAAVAAGYFEVPRAANAGDVAAELGISKSAFLERLRRGLGTLLQQVLT